jgi:hypothetical protein
VARRIFTARYRRILLIVSQALRAPAVSRSGGGIGRPVHLIIGSALAGLCLQIVKASRPSLADLLSQYWRGNGGGKDYQDTQHFRFGHLVFPFCRLSADAREQMVVRYSWTQPKRPKFRGVFFSSAACGE